MRVYLDEKGFETALSPANTVWELLEEVRGSLCGTNRLVMEIHADGRDITASDYTQVLEKAVDSFERYDFTTGEPRQVVCDALTDCMSLLDASDAKRSETIDLFTKGEGDKGAEMLGECCRAWQKVHEGIRDAMGLLKLGPADITIEGEAFAETLNNVRDQFGQIREALQARDFVLISDVLQYEFDPIIDNWRTTIEMLIEHARA
ncbi:MAG: hypothetical protein KAV82_10865 [Phycisphaerae bacterium]|nr:hypothetical protein [Phycisphaerae bacterium]